MPIEFRCHSCSKLLRTPDESAGKKAKCPQCGTIVDVPASATSGGQAAPPATDRPSAQAPGSGLDSSNPFGGPATLGMGAAGVDAAREPGGVNPYASPKLATDPYQAKVGVEGELVHNFISFDQILGTTWSLVTENLGPVMLFGLVMFVVNAGLGIVNQVIGFAAQASGVPAVIVAFQFASIGVNLVVQTWLWIVAVLFCTRFARDRRADLNVFSQAGPYFARSLGLLLVVGGIIVLLLLLFCGTPALVAWITTRDEGTTVVAAVIGVILWFIPYVLVLMNYMLCMFFVVDRQEGVFAAMGLSRKFMRGNKLTAFLVMLVVSILGGIVITCTLCLGRIVVDPFSFMAMTLIYLTATGQNFQRPLK